MSPMLFCPVSTQPQAVRDHKYTAESHGSGSQHGVEQAGCRSRDQDHIIEERPKQVLLDGAQRAPR